MVGIVIVSHLASIAEGICQMSKKMANESVVIIAAGGTANGSFGTDSEKICKAILNADNGKDGVIIITDVGSSIVSAGIALSDLPLNLHQRVRIADAPILEGAIAAASAAVQNFSVDEVLQKAEESSSIAKGHI